MHHEDERRILERELTGSVSGLLEICMEIRRTAMSDAVLVRVLPVPEGRRAIFAPILPKGGLARWLFRNTGTSQGARTCSEENGRWCSEQARKYGKKAPCRLKQYSHKTQKEESKGSWTAQQTAS